MRCVDRHGFELGIWNLSGLMGVVEGERAMSNMRRKGNLYENGQAYREGRSKY